MELEKRCLWVKVSHRSGGKLAASERHGAIHRVAVGASCRASLPKRPTEAVNEDAAAHCALNCLPLTTQQGTHNEREQKSSFHPSVVRRTSGAVSRLHTPCLYSNSASKSNFSLFPIIKMNCAPPPCHIDLILISCT